MYVVKSTEYKILMVRRVYLESPRVYNCMIFRTGEQRPQQYVDLDYRTTAMPVPTDFLLGNTVTLLFPADDTIPSITGAEVLEHLQSIAESEHEQNMLVLGMLKAAIEQQRVFGDKGMLVALSPATYDDYDAENCAAQQIYIEPEMGLPDVYRLIKEADGDSVHHHIGELVVQLVDDGVFAGKIVELPRLQHNGYPDVTMQNPDLN